MRIYHRNQLPLQAFVILIAYKFFAYGLVLGGFSTTTHQQQQHSNQHHGNDGDEIFSVAPMMGHTNRHHRYFFRQLSEASFLYTEMIPASQIVQIYDLIAGSSSNNKSSRSERKRISPEEIQETVQLFTTTRRNKSSPPLLLDFKSYNILQELLAGNNMGRMGPVTIQLGGRDPKILGQASAIAAAFGYTSINLNCGCPSSTVASGRQAGAALMKEPELVARCLEEMSYSMDAIIDPKSSSSVLSVKHRLGVSDADAYEASKDHEQNDEEAYKSCHDFCRLVGMAGKVSKIHVHARLALLGLGEESSSKNGDGGGEEEKNTNDHETDGGVSLWSSSSSSLSSSSTTTGKVNHKREQYFAKQRARQATINNRSIPPLRPKVVERIAKDFPNLQVVSNGGVQSIEQIQQRIFPNTQVTGVMVGRSAINHPCSFAGVDSILWGDDDNNSKTLVKPSRYEVLQTYIDYCREQEEQFNAYLLSSSSSSSTGCEMERKKNFRKMLIGAPFHLFVGEDGNDAYQRQLRKLVSRGDRYSSPSMLQAAITHIPETTLTKSVDDHTPWNEIQKYDFTKRSGAMQRTIY